MGKVKHSYRHNYMGYCEEQKSSHIPNWTSVFCLQAGIIPSYKKFTLWKDNEHSSYRNGYLSLNMATQYVPRKLTRNT